MSERKEGWYWVHDGEEWVPLEYKGGEWQDSGRTTRLWLGEGSGAQIGPRIPTPDEPWQCVPKEIHNDMLCAVGNHYGTEHEKAFEDAWDDALLAAPKPEDV